MNNKRKEIKRIQEQQNTNSQHVANIEIIKAKTQTINTIWQNSSIVNNAKLEEHNTKEPQKTIIEAKDKKKKLNDLKISTKNKDENETLKKFEENYIDIVDNPEIKRKSTHSKDKNRSQILRQHKVDFEGFLNKNEMESEDVNMK